MLCILEAHYFEKFSVLVFRDCSKGKTKDDFQNGARSSISDWLKRFENHFKNLSTILYCQYIMSCLKTIKNHKTIWERYTQD